MIFCLSKPSIATLPLLALLPKYSFPLLYFSKSCFFVNMIFFLSVNTNTVYFRFLSNGSNSIGLAEIIIFRIQSLKSLVTALPVQAEKFLNKTDRSLVSSFKERGFHHNFVCLCLTGIKISTVTNPPFRNSSKKVRSLSNSSFNFF